MLRKISASDLDFQRSVRLSASSYGLQLYKVIIVENPELRAQLLPAFGQTQVTDASHLFVIASQVNVGNTETILKCERDKKPSH
jgi:nitroreductase